MKSHAKATLATLVWMLAALTVHADSMLAIEALQRYPWDGMVDLQCHVSNPYGASLQSFTATDEATGTTFPAKTLLTPVGTTVAEGDYLPAGDSRLVWNAAADLPKGWKSDRMTLTGEIRNYQTVVFNTSTYSSDGRQTFLSATAFSGNEVTYEVLSGPGTLDGNALTFTGGGVVVIRATQTGDGDWMPASATNTLTAPYMVVDLSSGSGASSYPVTYLGSAPSGGLNKDAYKKTQIALRRIGEGTFMMGSPTNELGRSSGGFSPRETQHKVTLTKPYYIGVFEVTQTQWRQVTGQAMKTNALMPAYSKEPYYSTGVVGYYGSIRGTNAGAKWPSSNAVDAGTFMGKLRSKTGVTFDLPTEAQWEYACRAGTTTALNSGKNLTDTGSCGNLAALGRYYYNGGGFVQMAVVGSYKANAWGLYDMHGNVAEVCLDWVKNDLGGSPMTDPVGPGSGSERIARGGGADDAAGNCRSAGRWMPCGPWGFRLACPAQ